MSTEARLPGYWLGDREPIPAQVRLRRMVAALVRAQRMQQLVDHACGGTLAGVGLATVAVLAARLAPLPYSPWPLAGAAVAAALAFALAAGWRRRPDALDVVIRADLALALKQRLSTAWEFMGGHGDGDMAERLAVQAVKARLPVSAGRVFPLRLNRWGRLVPVAAAALLLASALDLDREPLQAPLEADERVVTEGQRLGEFGRSMQARARREGLRRSIRQAERIERLGAQMESGALSRAQALEKLRATGQSLEEEHMQALADGNAAAVERSRVERAGRRPEFPMGALPAPEIAAAPHGDGAGAPREGGRDSLRPGDPRREIDEAGGRPPGGGDGALAEFGEGPEPGDRAGKELEELQRAREQVRQARENLGEPSAGADGRRAAAAGTDTEQGAQLDGDDPEHRRRDGGMAGNDPRPGPRGRAGAGGERLHSSQGPDSAQAGPLLMPRSQPRAGEVLVFQGRVLPAEVRPGVENVELSREFAPQVEAALSREDYPAHYKAFVRRYFLSLSQGARGTPQPPTGTR